MDEFAWFMNAFHELTGIDLNRYKRPQMERRLTNLRDRRGFTDYPSYLRAMEKQRALLVELLDKMTINVSEFFRNPERWEQLGRILVERKEVVKAWSAACATGEEPYSLAMLLTKLNVPFSSILATDIDERVLAKASEGVYDAVQVRSVDETLLKRHFVPNGSSYTVKEQIRNQVHFQRHNLLNDPYPTSIDLIICRNVLIYFTDETKQAILNKFSAALKPGGILFVGSTEQFFGLALPELKLVAPFIYRREK